MVLEVNKFAFMKLDDKTVKGKDFQNGRLKGFDNDVRKAIYVFQNGKCLLCDSEIEHYHHITPIMRISSWIGS